MKQCIFTMWLIWPHPSTKSPAPGSWKLPLCRPFIGHHYYKHSLSNLCLGVNKIFKEIMHFYTFYPKITSPLGEGSWNLQFPVSLPYRCYVVLEKKMLTHDARRTTNDERRRTPTHSNRSPEWLRWPKNVEILSWNHAPKNVNDT